MARSKAAGVVVLVGQVEHFAARGRDQRPERDPRGGPRRQPDAAAKTEDRIEYGAGSVGQRPAVNHRDRRADAAPASQETRAIGLELEIARLISPSTTAICAAQSCGRRVTAAAA